jgi:hypothetical protein
MQAQDSWIPLLYSVLCLCYSTGHGRDIFAHRIKAIENYEEAKSDMSIRAPLNVLVRYL